MEQVPLAQEKSIEGIGKLSSTLLHKGSGGMRRDPRNLHAPRGQLHDHEDIIGHQATPGGDLHGEEVRGRKDLPVELEELPPVHAGLTALRGGLQVVATQDVPHRDGVDGMSQIGQGTLDAAIAPGGILFGHTDHELFDLLGHTRSAK
jgi:hypothetical protein